MSYPLRFSFLCLWLCSCIPERSLDSNPNFKERDGVLIFSAQVDGSLDSIQLHVDKATGKLVRILRYHKQDTLQIETYKENGVYAMHESFSFRNGKSKGFRVYLDTTLRHTIEGPIEGIDLPLKKQRAEYYLDGKNVKYVVFMTKGVTDSIYKLDSISQNLIGISYQPHTAEKLKQLGRQDLLQRTKKGK